MKARPMTRIIRVFKVVKGHFERYASRPFVKSVDFTQQKVEEIGEIVRDKHHSWRNVKQPSWPEFGL